MLKSERGLTLIEIMVALAIAGMLATTILFGRDNLQQQIKFAQSTDVAVATLGNVKTESFATVGRDTILGSGNSNQAVYGKYVDFVDGHSTINVYTVLATPADRCAISCSSGVTLGATGLAYSVQMPWGAKAVGDTHLVFGRGDNNTPQAFTTSTPHASLSGFAQLTAVPKDTPLQINLQNQDGSHDSTITIDQLGNITRVIN